MSHLIDLDSTYEKLVILQHFAHGSRIYSKERLLGSGNDTGKGEFDYYWGWVKGITSTYALSCSIQIRVLLDVYSDSPKKKTIEQFDEEIRLNHDIGKIKRGDFDLTIRESCNKIIHARKVVPIWGTAKEDDIEYMYWVGDLELSGTKWDDDWELILHISEWAKCVAKFLDKLESSELTLFVGQDWF